MKKLVFVPKKAPLQKINLSYELEKNVVPMSQTNMNCQAGSIALGLGSRSRVPKRSKTCTSVKLTLQTLHREINRFSKITLRAEKTTSFLSDF